MNASQVHLALTHLPVILSLVGMVVLALSFARNNISARKVALYILIVAGIAALPVFFTGEGAEEVVEKFSGVSESVIEKHEEVALFALIAILGAAVLSLVSVSRFIPATTAKPISVIVLIISLVSTGFMVQTAHLGGQIRHTEIRNAAAQQNVDQNNETSNEKDDD
jgi:lysylphosphatidylglycerol synthetase-like protein (DUF2156 family)